MQNYVNTSMHFSRMHTARRLTILEGVCLLGWGSAYVGGSVGRGCSACPIALWEGRTPPLRGQTDTCETHIYSFSFDS